MIGSGKCQESPGKLYQNGTTGLSTCWYSDCTLSDLPTDPIDWLYSHTPVDTVDKVNVKGIKDAAAILALTLMRIADDDEIPVKHTPSQKILSYLEENGIAEDLRVEKRWRRELSN